MRCRCLDCKKTFTPKPNSRAKDPQILEAIERALDERMAWIAIMRTFKVGWITIEKLAKKRENLLASLP